jgi:hypothetical protein
MSMGKKTIFRGLNVYVRDGRVAAMGFGYGLDLGPLAGAHAEVTMPLLAGDLFGLTSKHRVGTAAWLGVVLLGAGRGFLKNFGLGKSGKAIAVVTFADGTSRRETVRGQYPISRVMGEALRFNDLAAAAERRLR